MARVSYARLREIQRDLDLLFRGRGAILLPISPVELGDVIKDLEDAEGESSQTKERNGVLSDELREVLSELAEVRKYNETVRQRMEKWATDGVSVADVRSFLTEWD